MVDLSERENGLWGRDRANIEYILNGAVGSIDIFYLYQNEKHCSKLLLNLFLSETSPQMMPTWNRHWQRTHTQVLSRTAHKFTSSKPPPLLWAWILELRRQRWTTLDRSQHYTEHNEARAERCRLRKCCGATGSFDYNAGLSHRVARAAVERGNQSGESHEDL